MLHLYARHAGTIVSILLVVVAVTVAMLFVR